MLVLVVQTAFSAASFVHWKCFERSSVFLGHPFIRCSTRAILLISISFLAFLPSPMISFKTVLFLYTHRLSCFSKAWFLPSSISFISLLAAFSFFPHFTFLFICILQQLMKFILIPEALAASFSLYTRCIEFKPTPDIWFNLFAIVFHESPRSFEACKTQQKASIWRLFY